MSELPFPSGRHGGVLSAAEIKRLIEDVDDIPEPYRLIEEWTPANLREASYDVRVAPDGLVLPDGDVIQAGTAEKLNGPLVLRPGDSAWLSTFERFCLPAFVSGSVTLKSELASQGMLLLSGTLIDPRYGQEERDADATDSRFDRRLHFFVANLGVQAIVIRPRETPVASVQFSTVLGDLSDGPGEASQGARLAPQQPPANLGFLQDLKDVRHRYEVLEATTTRNSSLMRNLIIVGYFVLGTAVISASLATILTLSTNERLMESIRRAAPGSASGKLLVSAIALSIAWVIFSGAVLAGPRSAASRVTLLDARRQRDAAVRELRARSRARIWSSITLATTGLIFLGVGVNAIGGGAWWLVEVVAVALVVAAMIWTAYEASIPLTEAEIAAQVDRLALRGGSGAWEDSSRIRRILRRLLGRS